MRHGHEPALSVPLMLHRVNINVVLHGQRFTPGDPIDIDPTDPAWSGYLRRGWLEPLEEDVPPATVPPIVSERYRRVVGSDPGSDVTVADFVGEDGDLDLDTMNVGEILDWVGDDSNRASYALKVELDRSPPRTTLVAALRDRLGDDDVIGG